MRVYHYFNGDLYILDVETHESPSWDSPGQVGGVVEVRDERGDLVDGDLAALVAADYESREDWGE